MAQDPREMWRRLSSAVQNVQRKNPGLGGGGGPGRGAIGGMASLILLGVGVVAVNNSLFNGEQSCHFSLINSKAKKTQSREVIALLSIQE